jgi:general secretion pathway protein C
MKRNIIRGINIFLCLGIILISALLVRVYLTSRYMPLFTKEESKVKQGLFNSRPPDRFSDLGAILKSGMFSPKGRLTLIDLSKKDNITTGNTASKISSADSSITLIGTVVSLLGNNYAIFEERGSNRQEVFKKGAMVFNAGILTGIEKERAYLSIGGKTTSFPMPTVEINNLPIKEGIQKKNAALGRSRNNRSLVVSKKTGEREWIVDQRALSKTLENMGKVLTDARLLPYSKGGKINGFRLTQVKPRGIFGLIGLKNGDIILRVNDYEIDSPEKGMQLLTGLRGESRITLDIIRGGKPIKLNYQIR